MKHINKFLVFFITILLFINFSNTGIVFAENHKEENLISGSKFNTVTLNKFLNDKMEENLKKYKLPSLSMIVVKDGEIIYKNALGYQDIDNKVKADVNNTIYRIGSISKVFTVTAIMQLYEQGKIDLKEDANKYLKDVKIQNKFSKKVTIENLLTHTSGIDEATTPYGAAKSEKDMIALSEFLKKHNPVVVTEPGKICLYSNIGIDLLGDIIENVSGIRYEDYIEKNIFNVLGMKNSKVALPLNNMAKNYDSLSETKYYYYNDNPAGGINSTPIDMAKFMIAHLQNGMYEDKKILSVDTAKLMQEHHFANDNNLSGIAYGFWEKNFNGKRIIGHEGALAIGFFNDMLLIPEENLGIYIVSNNLTRAANAVTDIENDLINRIYPNNKTKEYNNKAISFDIAKKYIGTYRSYHDNAKSNFLKFLNFLGSIDENEDVKIDYDKNKNTLVYHGVSHLKKKENVSLIMVSDNLFKRSDNNDLVAFRKVNNEIKYIFFNNAPYDSFERVNLKDNYKINLVVLVITIVFFMYQILKNIFILLRNIYKKKYMFNLKKIKHFQMHTSRILKIIIFVISILNIIALVKIFQWMISFDMYYSVTLYMKISLVFLKISIILTVVGTIVFILSVKKEKTKLFYKILNFFSLLIIYAFVLFMWNWNILSI